MDLHDTRHLGRLLLEQGLLTESQLVDALQLYKSKGGTTDFLTALQHWGYLDAAQAATVLERGHDEGDTHTATPLGGT